MSTTYKKAGLICAAAVTAAVSARCLYRSNVRLNQTSWCLLVRHKPTMVTIDASLDAFIDARCGAARMA